mmetsp:Transcript_131342/g.379959  ORF Transcript_131342/g.379959 Transcript_131342/m.379959 type:complete len:279 (+) Transcript_131342:738-1574(+)
MQTTSCAATRSCSRCTAWRKASADWCGCPGMGISASTLSTSASGITALTASAAALALGRDSAASWCVKRLCRTGFDNETRPESTKVILRTPQPMSVLATPQPRVPAPRSKNFSRFIFSGSNSGSKRHFMSFTLRSTASAAMRFLSRKVVRSKFWIFDHPAIGAASSAKARAAMSAAQSTKTARDRSAASPARAPRCGSRKARNRRLPGRWCATARSTFRKAQPKAAPSPEESAKQTTRPSSGMAAEPRSAENGRTSHAASALWRTSSHTPAAASAASS